MSISHQIRRYHRGIVSHGSTENNRTRSNNTPGFRLKINSVLGNILTIYLMKKALFQKKKFQQNCTFKHADDVLRRSPITFEKKT